MKLLKKLNDHSLKLGILVATSTPFMAVASEKGIAKVNERLTDAAESFGSVLSIAAFIVGAAALFKAITTIMNHSENPRENPMKNVVFYGIAAGLGLGYGFFSTTALETVTGESKNQNIDEANIFKTN